MQKSEKNLKRRCLASIMSLMMAGSAVFNGMSSMYVAAAGNDTTINIATDSIKITNNAGTIEIDQGGTPVTHNAGDVIVIENSAVTANTITVGANVDIDIKLDGVDIDATTATAFKVEDNATVDLELAGTNKLVSGDSAGLEIDSSSTVNISGGGSLDATGANGGAGIGGDNGAAGGIVNISGGTIIAAGDAGAAGIGGGDGGAGGTVKITGGEVTVTSGSDAAGIGSGTGGSTGGSIDISSGKVTATGSAEGAGIGGGKGSTGGKITISGGNVTATAGTDAAGIGGGNQGAGGDIEISGGTIVASSVGAGEGVHTGKTVITGGSVNAASFDPQPTNGNASDGEVYLNTLTVGSSATAGKEIEAGNLDGISMGDRPDASSSNVVYGINDVYTDNNGKVYFLMKNNPNVDGLVSLDVDGTTYYEIWERNGVNTPATTLSKEAAPPKFKTQPVDKTAKAGDELELEVELENLTGQKSFEYQWYKANDQTSTGTAIVGANSAKLKTTAEAGTFYYYVEVTIVYGTDEYEIEKKAKSYYAEVITADANLKIKAQPKDAEVFTGDKVELKVEAEGDPTKPDKIEYQWYETTNSSVSGTAIKDETKDTLTVDTDKAGTYYYYVEVKATYSDGSTETVKSGVAEVIVKAKDSSIDASDIDFGTIEDSDPIPAAKAIEMSNSGNTDAEIDSVVLDKSESPFKIIAGDKTVEAGKTNDTWKVEPKSDLAAGATYTDKITITYNTNETKEINVTFTIDGPVAPLVDAEAPVFSAQPKDTAVQLGTGVTLTAAAAVTDGGNVEYQWYMSSSKTAEGTPINGATQSSYTVPNAQDAGRAFYYVVATNNSTNNPAVTGVKTAAQKSDTAEVIFKEKTPEAAIDYAAETITGLQTGNHTIGGTAVSIGAGSTGIDIEESQMNGKALAIVKKGSEAAFDSEAQNLIVPARPAAPKVTAVSESGKDKKDGKITGVTTAMEYSSDNKTWTACKGTEITGLAAGKYYVRIKAVADKSFMSKTAEVTIKTGSTETPKPVEMPFTDVKDGDWFISQVKFVWDNGIMNGTSTKEFSPDASVSRGMMATVLWNMEGAPKPKSTTGFTDLKQDWYVNAVNWAKEQGIVSGRGNNIFAPEESITRGDLAVMLRNYAEWKDLDISKKSDLKEFKDASTATSWALDALKWANAEGIVNGLGDGTIAPNATAKRAQLASMLMSFCEKYDLTKEK